MSKNRMDKYLVTFTHRIVLSISHSLIVFVSYTEFIERSCELNDLTNYALLMDCCKMIGYEVSKVVFRGYYASEQLQYMHDCAIEARVKLKLEVSECLMIALPTMQWEP